MHSQPLRNEMEADLLENVQIHQYQGDHHTGMCHPPQHLDILDASAKYQHTATAVGGWGHIAPLFLKNTQKTIFKIKVHFMNSKEEEQKSGDQNGWLKTILWEAFYHTCD